MIRRHIKFITILLLFAHVSGNSVIENSNSNSNSNSISDFNWGNCSVPTINTQNFNVNGRKYNILKKGGNITDTNGNTTITYESLCRSTSIYDIKLYNVNGSLVAYTDRDLAGSLTGTEIRLRNCNGDIMAIYKFDIIDSLLSVIKKVYKIEFPNGTEIATTDQLPLFDHSFTSKTPSGDTIFTSDVSFIDRFSAWWTGNTPMLVEIPTTSTYFLTQGQNKNILAIQAVLFILQMTSMDKDGNVQPALCQQLYIWAIVFGVVVGSIVIVFAVYYPINKCRQRNRVL